MKANFEKTLNRLYFYAELTPSKSPSAQVYSYKSFNFCFAFFHETTADKIYNFWTPEKPKSSVSFEAWHSVT